MFDVSTRCPICSSHQSFASPDDFWHCRNDLVTKACPGGICLVRERAMAEVLRSIYPLTDFQQLAIHEPAPSPRGISTWLAKNVPGYVRSGYFPDQPFGSLQHGLRNEDIEAQTFGDGVFDLVIHLDVMEHVFRPFQALREIHRTLRPHGRCVFTVPTYWDQMNSRQVAFHENGKLRIDGEPEYHGNPQAPETGALVTWRYGYDLPLLIQRETGFDVEVRRFQRRAGAIMGPMTEVYILSTFIAPQPA